MEITIERYAGEGGEWDRFVTAHPDSSNYHRYGWRRVIERSFGHRTFYLAARDRQGDICGLLPLTFMASPLFGRFLVSLPFFNYGGVLSSNIDATRRLLQASQELREELRASHAELRHLDRDLQGLETRRHKVTMLLDLERDEEAQWQALDPKVRNQIRKAGKSGLTVQAGRLELLDRFYTVFSRNMRDLGTPVYGKSFFRSLLEIFPDSTEILAVQLGEITVAAGLLTWFRGTLEVPWASSISDYRDRCPNNLLYWEAIRRAIGNGAGRFDFGRSTPGEGTYRFKKQWGARPVQLCWQYQLEPGAAPPELSPSNPRYRWAIRIWQQLPLPVTELLGPPIVRNIP